MVCCWYKISQCQPPPLYRSAANSVLSAAKTLTTTHLHRPQYNRPRFESTRARVGEKEKGLTFPSTDYRSFRRRVFPVNHLHWYWQPNKNNQETEHKHKQMQQYHSASSEQHTLKRKTGQNLVLSLFMTAGMEMEWVYSFILEPEPAWGKKG